jgi:hypothetical protein
LAASYNFLLAKGGFNPFGTKNKMGQNPDLILPLSFDLFQNQHAPLMTSAAFEAAGLQAVFGLAASLGIVMIPVAWLFFVHLRST